MKHALTLAIVLSLMLTACDERKNPVAEADPATVQSWLQKLETDTMKQCAAFWKAPEQASTNELEACESERQRIADAMNSGGFSNKAVQSKDLELKAVWMTYSTRLAERISRQEKTQESLKEIDDALGGFSKKRKGEQ